MYSTKDFHLKLKEKLVLSEILNLNSQLPYYIVMRTIMYIQRVSCYRETHNERIYEHLSEYAICLSAIAQLAI